MDSLYLWAYFSTSPSIVLKDCEAKGETQSCTLEGRGWEGPAVVVLSVVGMLILQPREFSSVFCLISFEWVQFED